MSELDQTPNDVTTTPAPETAVYEKHHHLIAFSALVITFLLAGVFFFFNGYVTKKPLTENQTPVVEEGTTATCEYASDFDAYNDAITSIDSRKCECVTDAEKRNACLGATSDDATVERATNDFDAKLCDSVSAEVKKQACIQAVESGIAYLTENDPQYLADKFLTAQNYIGVVELYEGAIADESTSARTLSRYAFALALTSSLEEGVYDEVKVEKAFTLLEEAKIKDPNEAEIYSVEGFVYQTYRSDYENAITAYSKSIELAPENINTYIGRGQTYKLQGDNEKAVADFEKAASLDTDKTSSQIYNNLCLLYGSGSTANKEKATSSCTTALTLETNPVMVEELQKSMVGGE